MAYRRVYLRVRSSGYNFGWTGDAEQAAFKEESRRLFQELGWTLHAGHSGVCDTVTKGNQDIYLHPLSFSGVMDEANIQLLQELLSKANTFQCSIEEKKMVASYLIKAVTLTWDYGIRIEFNMSEAQYLGGMEMG